MILETDLKGNVEKSSMMIQRAIVYIRLKETNSFVIAHSYYYETMKKIIRISFREKFLLLVEI